MLGVAGEVVGLIGILAHVKELKFRPLDIGLDGALPVFGGWSLPVLRLPGRRGPKVTGKGEGEGEAILMAGLLEI